MGRQELNAQRSRLVCAFPEEYVLRVFAVLLNEMLQGEACLVLA